jgi:hypothetical protein
MGKSRPISVQNRIETDAEILSEFEYNYLEDLGIEHRNNSEVLVKHFS